MMRDVALIQMTNRHGMTSKFELELPKDRAASLQQEYESVMANKQFYLDLIEKGKEIRANARRR